MKLRLPTVAMYGVPLAACTWWYTPVVRRMVDAGDFPAHVRFAQQIAATGQPTIPHFGYHLVVIAVHAMVPHVDWPRAALVATLAGLLATAAVIVWWIASAVPASMRTLRLVAAALLPPALLIVQPVLSFAPLHRDPWLIGYFPPSQFHNPTTLFSKPFALALFGFGAVAAFGGDASAWSIAGCGVLVLASALVKPSFLMAFLPAVGLLALARFRRANWRLLIAGLAVPAVAILAAQYLMRYRFQADYGVSVIFAPLMVVGLYSPTDVATLAWKLVASLAFPIAVTALWAPAAVRDRSMQLAWLTVAVGVSWGYLFAEGGGKASAGDFLWSGQLAVFLMFVVAAVFLLRRVAEPRPAGRGAGHADLRAMACVAVLALHVVSGVRHLHVSWFE